MIKVYHIYKSVMEKKNLNADEEEEELLGLDEYNTKFDNENFERNSILLLGVQAVGKTSIILKYFDNSSIENIKAIRPTIYQDLKQRRPLWSTTKFFRIFDLGGQKQFRQQHILQEEVLKNALAHIWVIDAQGNQAKFQESLNYFQDITAVLKTISDVKLRPKIFVLSHKHDGQSESLLALDEIQDRFSKLQISIESYYETSIFDDTIFEAITDIFFRLLAPEVLLQVFRYADLNSVQKIISKNEKESNKMAFAQGRLWAVKVRESWVRQQMGLKPLSISESAQQLTASIRLSKIGGRFILKVSKQYLPQSFSTQLLLKFLEGVFDSIGFAELNLLNESPDDIEVETFRKSKG